MPQEFSTAKVIPYMFHSKKEDEALKTISEVAKDLDIQPYVIRFWETKFPEISPLLRSGGRRYYASETVNLLHDIKHLLYTEKYTIRGVQQLLKSKTKVKKNISSGADMMKMQQKSREMKSLRNELVALRDSLKTVLKKGNK